MRDNKFLIIPIIAVAIFMLLLFGATFAYFNSSISMNRANYSINMPLTTSLICSKSDCDAEITPSMMTSSNYSATVAKATSTCSLNCTCSGSPGAICNYGVSLVEMGNLYVPSESLGSGKEFTVNIVSPNGCVTQNISNVETQVNTLSGRKVSMCSLTVPQSGSVSANVTAEFKFYNLNIDQSSHSNQMYKYLLTNDTINYGDMILYTATLEPDGGEVTESSVVGGSSTPVGDLPVPIKDGFYFAGWLDENTNTYYTSDMTLENDVTLTAQWTTTQKVARINSKYYNSVNSAVSSATNDDEIVLLVDASDYFSSYNKNLTFNLDGHKFTGWISSNAYLKIINGDLEYSGSTCVASSGELVIGDSNPNRKVRIYSSSAIVANGNATINNVELIQNDMNGFRGIMVGSNSTTTINNITIVSNSEFSSKGIENHGTTILNGGDISIVYRAKNNNASYAIDNDGTITINGGTISLTGPYSKTILNNNRLTINDGNIYYNPINYSNSIISSTEPNSQTTINGGLLSATKEYNNDSYVLYGIKSNGYVEINGGTFLVNSANNGAAFDANNLIINDALINVVAPNNAYGIYPSYGSNSAINGGILVINGQGNVYGMYANAGVSIDYNGGVIYSNGGATYGTGISYPNGKELYSEPTGSDNVYYLRSINPNITITFDANGGTVTPASVGLNSGDKAITLPLPSKTDNTFDGWYTSSNGGTKITKDTVFNSNTTIYAHWKS